jgi:hypothetical protein
MRRTKEGRGVLIRSRQVLHLPNKLDLGCQWHSEGSYSATGREQLNGQLSLVVYFAIKSVCLFDWQSTY